MIFMNKLSKKRIILINFIINIVYFKCHVRTITQTDFTWNRKLKIWFDV